MPNHKKLNIGIVLHDTPKYSETFFMSKIEGLANCGHKIYLFAPNKSNIKIKNCKIIEPYFINKNFFSLFLKLVKLLFIYPLVLKQFISKEMKDENNKTKIIKNLFSSAHILCRKIDYLHFGFATCALGKENVAAAIGAKMALSFRGYDINVYPLKDPNCYNKLWKKVDKVHSISDALYGKAINLGLSKKVPYKKITPAIDHNFFSGKVRTENKGPLRIFTVGRLSWIKGLDYAIQAMYLLVQQNISFTYTIAGDGSLNERLKFLAYSLNISDKIHFIGAVTKEEIKDHLCGSDIYLQPSLDEGFCNAVLEAQACKCLCIASDVGGLQENIIDNQTGWLVPKRSAIAIANKIKEVTSLVESQKQQVAEAAAGRVRKEFSLEEQIIKFSNFYSN